MRPQVAEHVAATAIDWRSSRVAATYVHWDEADAANRSKFGGGYIDDEASDDEPED